MKSLKVTDVNQIRNELNKYKKGKKFDIHQFNQVARLAYLGKVVLQPLDYEDPECEAMLVYIDHPEELVSHILDPDAELVGQMHIVDGQQARALANVLEKGMSDRVAHYQDLARRDFYFRQFFDSDERSSQDEGSSEADEGSE